MNRFWLWVPFAVLALAALATGETATTAPRSSTAPAGRTATGPAPLEQLRAEAFDQLLAGEFSAGAAGLKAVLRSSPDDLTAVQADRWVSEYLGRREVDAAEQKADYEAAVAMAKVLLAIAEHADDGEDEFAEVRKRLADVREIIVDLLAAPRVAENVTSEKWYTERLAENRAKITETFKRITKDLADRKGSQAEQICKGMDRLTAAMDAFAAEAATHRWGTHEFSERSADELTDQTEALAMAMDDLTSLVSERPWRAAVERLRLVQLIAGKDSAFMDQPWAEAIIEGAIRRAEAHEDAREWHQALALYETLNRLDKQNGRFETEIKYVTRRARAMTLYSATKGAKAASAEKGADEEPAGVSRTKPADSPEAAAGLKTAEWREYVSGVDAFMVGKALARIDGKYVETVDYRKTLLGALRAVRVLAQAPELAATFEGLSDEQAKDEFVARIDKMIEEASRIDDMDYRMVRRSLNRLLWANRQTVQIPDEVVAVEFADGVMKELDRFSAMIWPSEWPEFQKQMMGTFKGVGIQIQLQEDSGLLMVVTPLANSPAYRAGIKAGDFIMKIDGADAKNINIEEAVKRITGPEGTKVVLTIKRPGLASLLDKTLVREEIRIHTVKGWMRANGDGWDWFIDPDSRIGYVRITSFNQDTATELRQALTELQSRNVRGLILDLRGNPGGLMAAAVTVVDEFVSHGKIVSTKGRQQKTLRTHATESGAYLNGELVVLIDKTSASAAEIVSGALKDLERAVVIGERSFGKGSVQNLIPVHQDPTGANDAFLKVTTAYYYLPSERCLHRTDGAAEWGVEPDVRPAMTPRQIRRWVTLLQRTEIIKHRDKDQLAEDKARQFRADIQLDTALLVCRLRLLQRSVAAKVATSEKSEADAEDEGSQ